MLLDRLRRAAGARPSEVHISPDIDAKRLGNARTFADCGAELPLALIDNTVFGSGKKGVLITDCAVYFSEPAARLALADIVQPPVQVGTGDGRWRLDTRHGSMPLPTMLTDPAQACLVRLLSAIAAVNNNEPEAASAAPVPGPIGQLALAHLLHQQIALAPSLPWKKMQNAAAAFADWLDYPAGEAPLAYLDETAMGSGDNGVVLTDRRILSRVDDKHVGVPYAALLRVARGSAVLGGRIDLFAGPHVFNLKLITLKDAIPALVAFLEAVIALPPEQRWAPPEPWASADDPTGAATAARRLHSPDARVALLLAFVAGMVQRGWMTVQVGSDLVGRVALLHNSTRHGRGQRQGWYLSPLCSADLLYVLSTVFGQPMGGWQEAGRQTYDFAVTGKSGVGRAVASSAVGLALLATVGIGWVSVPKRSISGLRVSLFDFPSAGGFSLQGLMGATPAPIGKVAPDILPWLLGAVTAAEAELLLLRAAFGWTLPPPALYSQPPGSVEQAIGTVLGPVDLSPFRAA